MKSQPLTEQIKSIAVKGLFGRFHHTVVFPDVDDVAIITAPNGYGKTVLLRIIDNLFSKKLSYFWKLSFDEITVNFQSQKKLTVYKDSAELFEGDQQSKQCPVLIKAIGFGDDEAIHQFDLKSKDLLQFERYFPVERIGPDIWLDYRTEVKFSTHEILDIYADQISDGTLPSLKFPDWLSAALNSVTTRLVETQRLLSLDDFAEGSRTHRRERKAPSSVVEKDAADLAKRIGQTLQTYANDAQKLDQSFPKRIIEFLHGNVADDKAIKASLDDLGKKRDALVEVGLIGHFTSDPILPTDTFENESVRRILSIYVDDTTQKLNIFNELYARLRLFKEIIDEHFMFKRIEITPTEGICAIDEATGSPIALSDLSSGEQHELVLIYELLFKVQEGSLILIDEPELSLHVAWQKRFIANIQKIQKLKRLRVVIATHSPQIINERWDLVQELSSQ